MNAKTDTNYLVEITQEQKFTVNVDAESAEEAIELANSQQGYCECEFPPEILIGKTRVIE
jgi:hypothetical protein